ncbi:major capsid protein [Pantoea phage Nufs112]|nr:major capsid protein [Pantoea phage Nufs112]
MSSANNLVNPAVSYSGEVDSLLIEKFDGQVKRAYKEKLNMKSYFDIRTVNGTNSISNKYLGTTGVQALAPGADVKGQATAVDKNQLVIDTAVIARNIVGVLADVQDDIMIKGKLAEEQVDALSYLEDRMLLQQVIYSAIKNTKAKRTNPRVPGHGFSIDVKVKLDTMEVPNAVMAAVEYVIEQMMTQDVPVERMTIAMPWKYFNILRDAERIINATYNTSQRITVRGFVLTSYNIPVVPTNQMPDRDRDHRDVDGNVATNHLLSNGGNGNRYNVINTGADSMDKNIVAVIFGTEALLAGRSIDLQGKIWFNDSNKSWYIDSWMAEGAIPDRWEQAGVVRVVADASATDDVDVRKRANRKALPVSSTQLPIA